MLSGTVILSVDDKHRILIPDRFRFEMSEEFVLTRGFDRCLFVFPYDDWAVMVHDRTKKSGLDRLSVLWDRWFVASAVKAKCDNQGRLTLPEALRLFAQIGPEESRSDRSNDVALCGTSTRLEIWALHNWTTFVDEVKQDDLYAAVSQVLGGHQDAGASAGPA